MTQLLNLIFADPVQGPDAPLPMDVQARDLQPGDLIWLFDEWPPEADRPLVPRPTGHWCSIVNIHWMFGDERLNLHVRVTSGAWPLEHREVTVYAADFAHIRRFFPTTNHA